MTERFVSPTTRIKDAATYLDHNCAPVLRRTIPSQSQCNVMPMPTPTLKTNKDHHYSNSSTSSSHPRRLYIDPSASFEAGDTSISLLPLLTLADMDVKPFIGVLSQCVRGKLPLDIIEAFLEGVASTAERPVGPRYPGLCIESWIDTKPSTFLTEDGVL